MNAWIDGEVTEETAAKIEAHLSGCERCAADAEDLRRLTEILNAIPGPVPPEGLQEKILSRRDNEMRSRGFLDWWHGSGWGGRSALCASALVGLWTGCNLGVFLTCTAESIQMDMLAAISFAGDVLQIWG